MKKKLIVRCSITVVAIIGVIIYVWNTFGVTPQPGHQTDHENLLLTVTDTDLNVHYNLYDRTNDQTTTLATKPLTDYPTAIVTSDLQKLYITQRQPNKLLQLYEMDRTSNQLNELTDSFSSADFLHLNPKTNTIYMRVLLPGHKNFTIASYNINTKAVQIWNANEDDLSVKDFDVDPTTGEIAALTYSVKKEYARIAKNNKTQDFTEQPTFSIGLVQFDNNQFASKVTLNKEILDVSYRKNRVLFTALEEYISQNRSIFSLDVASGSITEVLKESPQYKLIKQPRQSIHDDGFYFIGSLGERKTLKDKTGEEIQQRAICFYDEKSGEIKQLWTQDGGNINNYILVYQ